jgi:hypothetical protein
LNESLIIFFKQGTSLGLGAGSPRTSISSMCQICNAIDHIVIVCSRIGDLKPKCNKCGLPHRTKSCGLKCGYYTWMGHTE